MALDNDEARREALLKTLLTRSIDTIYPSKEALYEALTSGKTLRVYMGIDPTSTYAHLGHSTNYIILKRFQELGHKVIVLIGDFTALIGDPSDKSSARVRLTKEEVQKNLAGFKGQISKILDFDDPNNPVEFRFNSEWLSKLTFEDSVELASNFTVQQMLERDAFEKRLAEEKPLYVHEFFYPLMQGYDSVALEADVEVGGTDQTFNMLAGRTLVRRYQNREKFVVTTTLLENPVTGEKLMSKSLGTGIGLDESANEMYAKVMALPDEAIIRCFIDCTYLPLEEIEGLQKELENGANPRDIKMHLAREVVTLYHSEGDALVAEEAFRSTFSRGEIPEDIETVAAASGTELALVLKENGVVSSLSDFRRLVEQGAVWNMVEDEKITDPRLAITKDLTLRVGKRRFVRIKAN